MNKSFDCQRLKLSYHLKEMNEKRVGLLGGSFDPIHKGHIAIAKSFIASGYIDELWILVNPSPPHKTDLDASYEHRKKMVELAYRDIYGVHISLIEEELPMPNYTINTIKHILNTYALEKLYFCLGMDSLESFHTWKSYDEILSFVDLLVAERDQEFSIPNYLKDKVTLVKHSVIDVSSTKVRKALLGGEPVTSLLDHTTIHYINYHHLYQRNGLK